MTFRGKIVAKSVETGLRSRDYVLVTINLFGGDGNITLRLPVHKEKPYVLGRVIQVTTELTDIVLLGE